MNVLWVINSMLPEVAAAAKRKAGFGGGWIPSMAARLKQLPDVSLSMVVFGKNEKLEQLACDGITYFVFPEVRGLHRSGGGQAARGLWEQIISRAKPDVVHIYGTEQPTCLELVEGFPEVPVVVSLQGILTEYYRHYYGAMEFRDIVRHITPADVLLGASGFFGRRKFRKKIPYEQRILRAVRYVEGRTEWDQAVSANINPALTYYHCPRMLREPFYQAQPWSAQEAQPHSIFVHQGNYAIKGLHMLMEALAIVRRAYPDVKLHIAGQSPRNKNTLRGKLSVNGYSRYILRRMKELGLEEAVEYLGGMDAAGIARQLRSSHVMVIPSAIENSPNSLAEAMIVGTPCVASFVGGNAQMLGGGSAGQLYCYDDPVMLARAIMEVFASGDLAVRQSEKARQIALQRHDPVVLTRTMHDIYADIMRREKERE